MCDVLLVRAVRIGSAAIFVRAPAVRAALATLVGASVTASVRASSIGHASASLSDCKRSEGCEQNRKGNGQKFLHIVVSELDDVSNVRTSPTLACDVLLSFSQFDGGLGLLAATFLLPRSSTLRPWTTEIEGQWECPVMAVRRQPAKH